MLRTWTTVLLHTLLYNMWFRFVRGPYARKFGCLLRMCEATNWFIDLTIVNNVSWPSFFFTNITNMTNLTIPMVISVCLCATRTIYGQTKLNKCEIKLTCLHIPYGGICFFFLNKYVICTVLIFIHRHIYYHQICFVFQWDHVCLLSNQHIRILKVNNKLEFIAYIFLACVMLWKSPVVFLSKLMLSFLRNIAHRYKFRLMHVSFIS